MFDFYDDIYSGTLKRKVNILSFFQNTGLKIAKAIDRGFLHYLKNLFKNLRHEPLRKVIKVYEKPTTNLEESIKKVNKNQEKSCKKAELKKIFERNFNQTQNINEIIIEDYGNENNLQREIEEFFKENQPKNKGWLFRKSQETGNNWQNLFFCLVSNNTKLISLNPKTLRKALNISYIQIHKCIFLESIPHEQIIKGHKKIVRKGNESEENSKKSFFIVDLVNLKTYLIRSDESLAILSVINFYISKNKNSNKPNANSLIQIIETVEPYYSGIIEIACCKKNDLTNFHSDLKSYSFKSQFLEIKSNKLLIYKYSLKDSLNISDYDLKLQENGANNKSQGFMFSLEKKTGPATPGLPLESEINNSMKESFVVFNTIGTNEHNDKIEPNNNKKEVMMQKNNPTPKILVKPNKNFELSPKNQKTEKKIQNETHFNELEVIYEKEEGHNNNEKKKKGSTTGTSFKDFFLKLAGKKNEKVFLAADTEFKRKEWVFSLNYYKTLILKDLISKKNDGNVSKHESMNGMKHEKKINNLFKSSLVEKSGNNPDFYDVFSPNNENDEGLSLKKNNELQTHDNQTKKHEILNTHMNLTKPIKNTRNAPGLFTDPDAARNLGNKLIIFFL